MSLSQALSIAVAGLRANQIGMSVVASNVANADTPGYVRKSPIQVTTVAGQSGVGVHVAGINRHLDQYVQRQLRVEMAGASYAGLRSEFYNRLQGIYGVPGSDGALTSIFDDFSASLQALAASPESPAARTAVLSAAQVLAQQLNSMSSDVQALRTDAEYGLADAVMRANDAMKRIAEINRQLGTTSANDVTAATLMDDRDRYIDELAQLMDIRVVQTDHNQVTVFTNSGLQLVGIQASALAFDAKGSITAASEWNIDPTKRGVGTIELVGVNGGGVDLIASGSIRSGTIAAYLEMRDQILVEAQTQLDQIAAALAGALSDRTIDGSAVVGVPAGFDIDIGNLSAGNAVHLTYTDNLTGMQHSVTLMRVDDPAALPLSDDVTPDPNDRVIGINFSAGMGSVVTQLTSALGSTGLQFSNTGSTLHILDDGATDRVNVDAVSATHTVTSLTGGSAEFPFFLDAAKPYTGAVTSTGPQSVGLAGRIAVNVNLLSDPTRLVVFQISPPTAAGDATRPSFLLERLTNASLEYAPSSGIGSNAAPYRGPLPSFIRQIISHQGDAAAAAAMLSEGQEVVLNALLERFNDDAAVNVDAEMANLLNLQNAYAANARVMSTVKEMMETLMAM